MLILIAKLSAFCYNFSFCLAVLTLTSILRRLNLFVQRDICLIFLKNLPSRNATFPTPTLDPPPENLAKPELNPWEKWALMNPLKILSNFFFSEAFSPQPKFPSTILKLYSSFRELDAQTENETETRVQ